MAGEDMKAHEAALTHVLAELKRNNLGSRVTLIEVSSRGFTISFEPTTPPQSKKSAAELALERASEEEDIMYGSAGG